MKTIKKLGIKCIDADRKAHEVYKQGTPTYDKVNYINEINL